MKKENKIKTWLKTLSKSEAQEWRERQKKLSEIKEWGSSWSGDKEGRVNPNWEGWKWDRWEWIKIEQQEAIQKEEKKKWVNLKKIIKQEEDEVKKGISVNWWEVKRGGIKNWDQELEVMEVMGQEMPRGDWKGELELMKWDAMECGAIKSISQEEWLRMEDPHAEIWDALSGIEGEMRSQGAMKWMRHVIGKAIEKGGETRKKWVRSGYEWYKNRATNLDYKEIIETGEMLRKEDQAIGIEKVQEWGEIIEKGGKIMKKEIEDWIKEWGENKEYIKMEGYKKDKNDTGWKVKSKESWEKTLQERWFEMDLEELRGWSEVVRVFKKKTMIQWMMDESMWNDAVSEWAFRLVRQSDSKKTKTMRSKEWRIENNEGLDELAFKKWRWLCEQESPKRNEEDPLKEEIEPWIEALTKGKGLHINEWERWWKWLYEHGDQRGSYGVAKVGMGVISDEMKMEWLLDSKLEVLGRRWLEEGDRELRWVMAWRARIIGVSRGRIKETWMDEAWRQESLEWRKKWWKEWGDEWTQWVWQNEVNVKEFETMKMRELGWKEGGEECQSWLERNFKKACVSGGGGFMGGNWFFERLEYWIPKIENLGGNCEDFKRSVLKEWGSILREGRQDGEDLIRWQGCLIPKRMENEKSKKWVEVCKNLVEDLKKMHEKLEKDKGEEVFKKSFTQAGWDAMWSTLIKQTWEWPVEDFDQCWGAWLKESATKWKGCSKEWDHCLELFQAARDRSDLTHYSASVKNKEEDLKEESRRQWAHQGVRRV